MNPLQTVDIQNSCYFSGDAMTCLLDQLTNAFGLSLFGLLIGAILFYVFYIAAEGDMATPTVALVLSGTVLVNMVPGQYQSIATGVVVIGLAAALWQVVKKYVLSGVLG